MHGTKSNKQPKKSSLEVKKNRCLTTLLKEMTPSELEKLRHDAEILIRRIALKARNIERLSWAAGLLYMLDGICCRMKM